MLKVKPELGSSPATLRNTLPMLRSRRAAKDPITITVNGTVHLVEDDESFGMLLDLVDRLETLASLREGLESIGRGEGRPVGEFFDELEREIEALSRA